MFDNVVRLNLVSGELVLSIDGMPPTAALSREQVEGLLGSGGTIVFDDPGTEDAYNALPATGAGS